MQTTANTAAFIEAEVYSSLILRVLHDQLLSEAWYRNVADFDSGTNYRVKVIGASETQPVEEDRAIKYTPIDTGEVVLNITNYEGTAFYITDKLRQDGAQIPALLAARSMEDSRAIAESFESSFFRTAGLLSQTPGNTNAINGFAHRWVADAAANNSYKIGLQDFFDMKVAFDKANVPLAGRVAVVDPVVEATLNKLAVTTLAMDRNPKWQQVLEEGFASNHQFLFNIGGWDIYTSNRLPRTTATETITGPSGVAETAPIGSVANVFMNVLDDSLKPVMGAWRQLPRAESERNKDLQRDEFVSTARWGFGSQRDETLGVILTSASNY